MALLAVEGAVDDIAGVGQRGRQLPIEIGIVLDNEETQFILRLSLADHRAFRCVDGYPRHFAIARENCQHIDEPVLGPGKAEPAPPPARCLAACMAAERNGLPLSISARRSLSSQACSASAWAGTATARHLRRVPARAASRARESGNGKALRGSMRVF